MRGVRPPAVAGFFYPGDPAALANSVEACLASPLAWDIEAKAIVAPHAGYVYSGSIAGTAYGAVKHMADRISRVVLLGPAHRVPFRGIAVPSAEGLATPLGDIPVDWEALKPALAQRSVHIADSPFEGEHALEVHLPFLQRSLGAFSVVPLLIGQASAESVERVLEALWGGPETLIVVSSDLSHFHDYKHARTLDETASRAIEIHDDDALDGEHACGYRAVAGLLRRAAAEDLRATTLDLRNSGDTAGDKSRVVGYGAYAFENSSDARLPAGLRQQVLDAARSSVRHGVTCGTCAKIDLSGYPRALRAARRTFVSVHTAGQLRGCVGSLALAHGLVEDVVQNAFKAALQDQRFAPLGEDELADTRIGVSIMSTPREIRFRSESELIDQLRPHADGLIVEDGEKSALFLPVVWDQIDSPREFVRHLKGKAGMSENRWSGKLKAWRFGTECFEGDSKIAA